MNIDFSAVLVVLTFASGTIWLLGTLYPTNRNVEILIVVEYARFLFLISLVVLAVRYFGIEKVLVVLTFASGTIWLLGTLYLTKRSAKEVTGKAKIPIVVEYAKFLFQIVFVVLVLRSFVIEPFRIPTGSMMPTLLIGDFILVNKYAYGIRLPILNKKIIENKIPERGDIVVFRYPLDPSIPHIKRVVGLPGDKYLYQGIPFIKRVVGLPGDKYLYRDKILYINGQPAKQVGEDTYKAVGAGKMMDGATVSKEILPNIEYSILKLPDRPSLTFEGFVPEGHYFVLGDNRDNSADSRVWGFVPEANLVGRAFMIWMNFDWEKSPWIDWIDWQRIGMMIR